MATTYNDCLEARFTRHLSQLSILCKVTFSLVPQHARSRRQSRERFLQTPVSAPLCEASADDVSNRGQQVALPARIPGIWMRVQQSGWSCVKSEGIVPMDIRSFCSFYLSVNQLIVFFYFCMHLLFNLVVGCNDLYHETARNAWRKESWVVDARRAFKHNTSTSRQARQLCRPLAFIHLVCSNTYIYALGSSEAFKQRYAHKYWLCRGSFNQPSVCGQSVSMFENSNWQTPLSSILAKFVLCDVVIRPWPPKNIMHHK